MTYTGIRRQTAHIDWQFYILEIKPFPRVDQALQVNRPSPSHLSRQAFQAHRHLPANNNNNDMVTSGQNNLTKGRIATAHGRYASLDPPESISQTAARSVQPFLHSSRQTVPLLYNGQPFSPKIAPSHTGSGLHRGSLGHPPESTTQTKSGSVEPFCRAHDCDR